MYAERAPIVVKVLETERLDLTPLDAAADAPSLHPMLSDPRVHRYDTDAQPSRSVAETRARLERQLMANGGSSWAIRMRGSEAIGTIGVFADQGTTIRGVGWSLTRSYWQQGITSEAARAVIPFLLRLDGVDGLEAWVDSDNLASIGVARAAGMSERSRLPRASGDRVGQTVVLARAAVRKDPEVLGSSTRLLVSDLVSTRDLMRRVLDLHVSWEVPDPPTLSFLAFEPWSGSAGFLLQEVATRIAPRTLSLDVGLSVDTIRARVVAAGLHVLDEPKDRPWFRRDMAFQLPDGHRIEISGPSSPQQS